MSQPEEAPYPAIRVMFVGEGAIVTEVYGMDGDLALTRQALVEAMETLQAVIDTIGSRGSVPDDIRGL